MTLDAIRDKFAIISFVFFSSLLSGLVLIGICSSFSLMLSERGVNVSTITHILFATIPYSWKFAISPFIKNIILKYRHLKFDIVKVLAYSSQFVLFIGFSSLGTFENRGSLNLSALIILLVVLAVSIQDIIRAHIKLTLFDIKDLGFVSAIENTGFRLGMFISGACIIYIANSMGWFASFLIASSIVLFSTCSTFFIKRQNLRCTAEANGLTSSLRGYIKVCGEFFRKYGIVTLLLVIISFKMTDSCINILKPMFMHFLGISRLAFANMTHFYGLISMIASGIVAGILLSRIGINLCINATLSTQMIASLIFMYLSTYKADTITITILVNVVTFFLGFSGVVFRTLVAQEAKKDVNIYAMLLSIGSLVRICSYSFSGIVVDNYSWGTMYFLCLLSNIPGYFLYSKLKKGNKNLLSNSREP